MDLALNNLQRLICHKTKQTNQTIIRLFNVITRTLVGGSLIPQQIISWCILYPQPTGPPFTFVFV